MCQSPLENNIQKLIIFYSILVLFEDADSIHSESTVYVYINGPPRGFQIDANYPYPYVSSVESSWLMKQGVVPGMVLEKINNENVG